MMRRDYSWLRFETDSGLVCFEIDEDGFDRGGGTAVVRVLTTANEIEAGVWFPADCDMLARMRDYISDVLDRNPKEQT